jgi:alpha-beta hydrolase superfamily lysophospholipase
MADAQAETSWLPELLARLAMASGVGYLAAAYTISRWLTRPSPGSPTSTPSALDLDWEPLECRTADAVRLAGWAVTPPAPRATIALFHGLRGNREQTLDRSAFLAAAGYRSVAFDHRAHGESSGKRTSFGYLESQDVIAVLETIRRRWPDQPCGALGVSMGGAALCYAASRLCGLAAIVLESVYHDIGSALTSRIGNDFPLWYRQLTEGVVWVTERRLGVRMEQLAPVKHVGALAPTPVLFLTGANDPHATPEDTRRLCERCGETGQMWLVPEAGHRDVFAVGGGAYQQRVLGFFDRCLVQGR